MIQACECCQDRPGEKQNDFGAWYCSECIELLWEGRI